MGHYLGRADMPQADKVAGWSQAQVLADLADLKTRMGVAEEDLNTDDDQIVDLKTRITAAESSLVTDAAAILDLQGRVSALEQRGAATAAPGTVDFDSFVGGDDDAKLTAALAYISSQTAKPTLVFPKTRDLVFQQRGRMPFSGLRIDGGAPSGPLNLEIGNTVPYRIRVNTSGPWWDSTGINLQSTWFGHFACQYSGGSWFWRSNYASGGTSPYPVEFEHMAHYGGAGVFGTYAEKCTMTQAVFSGHWATMGFTDTPYHLGGSDMDLWTAGQHNIESQQLGNAKPIIWADYLSNTNIGPVYLTSPKGWRGVRVTGDVAETKGCALSIYGARIEGHNTSLPAYGTLLDIQGGQVDVRAVKVAWPMTQPAGDLAPIQVSGNADVSLDGLFYDQWNYSGPMVNVASGTVRVINAKSITRQPMVVKVAGGTVTHDESVTVQ